MREDTEYKLRTHLISPTIDANPIFKSLESLDMEKDTHYEYSDEILQKIIKDIREKKEKYDEYIKYQDYYKNIIILDDLLGTSAFTHKPKAS
jgi:hypothetical protein